MKAELLKRLFRAIVSSDKKSVSSLLKRIIAEKKKSGYHNLAQDLEHILNKSSFSSQEDGAFHSLTELGFKDTDTLNLVQIIEGDRLRNNMVLSAPIEAMFSEIEREYAARKELSQLNLNYAQKILLFGPPGCGKSLGAERIGKNLNLPILKVSLDRLVDSYLGKTSKNIKRVFEMASNLPCVLFFDECDALMMDRANKADIGEISRTLNVLLQILDDFPSQDSLIIGATNLQTKLDTALYRRFDKIIHVSKPTSTEAENFLEFLLKEPIFDCKKLAEQVTDMSYSEIEKIYQIAAKKCFFEKQKLTQNKLKSAFVDAKKNKTIFNETDY